MADPRSLTLVRAGATVVIGLAVNQAGLASGYLGGVRSLKEFHEIFGFVTLAGTLIATVLAWRYVRDGGPRWMVWLAGSTALLATTQIGLAEAKVKGLHIFVGVLFAMLATAFTSWAYRHRHQPAGADRFGDAAERP